MIVARIEIFEVDEEGVRGAGSERCGGEKMKVKVRGEKKKEKRRRRRLRCIKENHNSQPKRISGVRSTEYREYNF